MLDLPLYLMIPLAAGAINIVLWLIYGLVCFKDWFWWWRFDKQRRSLDRLKAKLVTEQRRMRQWDSDH